MSEAPPLSRPLTLTDVPPGGKDVSIATNPAERTRSPTLAAEPRSPPNRLPAVSSTAEAVPTAHALKGVRKPDPQRLQKNSN